MAKTTTDLLNNIKRRTQLPDDGGTLSDTDILAFATDELQNVVMPRLMAMNEWHYAFSYTQSLSSSREYRINPRVAGNRIISVELLDGSDYRFIKLSHPLTQWKDFGESYSIYGNKIVLSEACPTSGSIRVRAVLRPSDLILTGVTYVTAGTSAGGFNVDIASDEFGVGDVIDFVYDSSPYETIDIDNTITVDSGSSYTLSNPVLGDYLNARVCPAGQSDRVMLPDELHDYLAQRVAIRCMEARGFTQDMQNHLRKLQDLEMAFDRLVAPRNKGEFKAIVNEDFSLFRRY